MGNASAAFGKLQNRLWKNRHVSMRVKCKVYEAFVLSYLLYGAGNVDYVSELSEEAACSRYDDYNERSE